MEFRDSFSVSQIPNAPSLAPPSAQPSVMKRKRGRPPKNAKPIQQAVLQNSTTAQALQRPSPKPDETQKPRRGRPPKHLALQRSNMKLSVQKEIHLKKMQNKVAHLKLPSRTYSAGSLDEYLDSSEYLYRDYHDDRELAVVPSGKSQPVKKRGRPRKIVPQLSAEEPSLNFSHENFCLTSPGSDRSFELPDTPLSRSKYCRLDVDYVLDSSDVSSEKSFDSQSSSAYRKYREFFEFYDFVHERDKEAAATLIEMKRKRLENPLRIWSPRSSKSNVFEEEDFQQELEVEDEDEFNDSLQHFAAQRCLAQGYERFSFT